MTAEPAAPSGTGPAAPEPVPTERAAPPGAGPDGNMADPGAPGGNVADPDVADLFERARGGDRRALGRLLTYAERGGARADAVAVAAWPLAGSAHVVGITGAPGVGKSTLTDRLAQAAAADGRRVAILAVDPSSPLTGGAILGDRVRMGSAAEPGGPFVRSMASRGQSGGLALAALAAIRLLDATGHDLVLVETVGIGQVEVDIAKAADTTVVAVSPGWGDAVQANKAGLLEMADVFVVNKADRAGATDARRDLEYMLDLGHRAGWRPPVTLTVATSGDGADELWKHVLDHRRHVREHADDADRLARHAAEEVRRHLHRGVDALFEDRSGPAARLLAEVTAGRLAPSEAALRLAGELADRPGVAGGADAVARGLGDRAGGAAASGGAPGTGPAGLARGSDAEGVAGAAVAPQPGPEA